MKTLKTVFLVPILLSVALLSASGGEPTRLRVVTFAGQTWEIKRGRGLGPGPNDWSDTQENVWLDKEGCLHLAIARDGVVWKCAEIVATQSLGYGEYRWVIAGSLPAIEPRVALGLFLYEDDQREIDFELSRWAKAENANAQFVVQPPEKDSIYRFDTGKADVITISLSWQKTLVRGRCWVGKDTSQKPLVDWKCTEGKIPPTGNERVRANLWLVGGIAPPGMGKREVVIQSFHFTPAAPKAR